MKTILITGATGFIGRHVCNLFINSGWEVHGTYNYTLPVGSLINPQYHRLDLNHFNRVSLLLDAIRPTHLLHLAWDITPGDYLESEKNISCLNFSINLAKKFLYYDGRRMVSVGTCLENPKHSYSMYGICKRSSSDILNKMFIAHGAFFASPKIYYLFGPGENEKRVVPSVILSLLKGHRAILSHGNQIRDFLYVEDVAKALYMITDSDFVGDMDVCSGTGITIKNLVYMIGNEIRDNNLKPDYDFGGITVPKNEPKKIVGDPKWLNVLGFKPSYINIYDGLHKTVKWWKMIKGL